jgi:hypothetical protein
MRVEDARSRRAREAGPRASAAFQGGVAAARVAFGARAVEVLDGFREVRCDAAALLQKVAVVEARLGVVVCASAAHVLGASRIRPIVASDEAFDVEGAEPLARAGVSALTRGVEEREAQSFVTTSVIGPKGSAALSAP